MMVDLGGNLYLFVLPSALRKMAYECLAMPSHANWTDCICQDIISVFRFDFDFCLSVLNMYLMPVVSRCATNQVVLRVIGSALSNLHIYPRPIFTTHWSFPTLIRYHLHA